MNLYNYCLVFLAIFTATFTLTDCKRSKSKDKSRGDSKATEMDSLICPDCDRLFCTVRKASKLKCPGGKTTDICGCCPVCAKQEGQACGGEWNYLGKCDAGYYCKASSSSLLTPLYQEIEPKEVPMGGMPEGTCVKTQDIQKDGGSQPGGAIHPRDNYPKCEPKCTPDYCLRNPRSICSAVDVVDMKRDCHGSCQHTSCQACSWVDPDPECGACASDDFSCIKRFAKCIKRSYCTRSKFPCKSIAEKDHVGKFQCMVPKCLDIS